MGSRSDCDVGGESQGLALCRTCGKKPPSLKRKECAACRSAYYRSTPEGKARSAAAQRKWRENNCDTAYWQDRYAKQTPERLKEVKEARRKAAKRNQTCIQMAKTAACEDCGGKFHSEAMDFDHVRGEKLFNISTGACSAMALIVLLAEMAKCEIVCANCHRVRTWRRRSNLSE